jgi:hypothetical protein
VVTPNIFLPEIKKKDLKAHQHDLWALGGTIIYCNSTTQVPFVPADFMARLAALVLKPRVNLILYHGVLAPKSPMA